MDLRTFIAQSLTQLHEGINDANSKVPGICPPSARTSNHPEEFGIRRSHGGKVQAVQFIEFDIAPGVTKTEGGKAALGVAVLGAGVQTETTRENASRIRFKIPVVLPSDMDGE